MTNIITFLKIIFLL